jgi:hypothetical protein
MTTGLGYMQGSLSQIGQNAPVNYEKTDARSKGLDVGFSFTHAWKGYHPNREIAGAGFEPTTSRL